MRGRGGEDGRQEGLVHVVVRVGLHLVQHATPRRRGRRGARRGHGWPLQELPSRRASSSDVGPGRAAVTQTCGQTIVECNCCNSPLSLRVSSVSLTSHAHASFRTHRLFVHPHRAHLATHAQSMQHDSRMPHAHTQTAVRRLVSVSMPITHTHACQSYACGLLHTTLALAKRSLSLTPSAEPFEALTWRTPQGTSPP